MYGPYYQSQKKPIVKILISMSRDFYFLLYKKCGLLSTDNNDISVNAILVYYQKIKTINIKLLIYKW